MKPAHISPRSSGSAKPHIGALLRCAAAALALATLTSAAPPPQFDLIIRGGMVIDGTGAKRVRADIGIRQGHIAEIGDLGAAAGPSIDAKGLMVAPGFINIHDHADAKTLASAANMLAQGVTTEIMNADGLGPIDLASQLDAIARDGSAVNFGGQIGLNAIWKSVMDDADRRATPAEIERMRALLTRALDDGAWGVSSGFDFAPVSRAHVDDIVAILSAARDRRTNFPNHDRVTPENGFSSLAGMRETIAVAERAGLMPVITHVKLQGHEQGRANELFALMKAAAQRGTPVAADIYPYLAGQTALEDLLISAWAQVGGRPGMLARFRDPAQRAEIAKAAETAMRARFGGPQGVFVLAGRSELTAIMAAQKIGAGEAVIRSLEANATPAILRFGSEADLRLLLAYPGIAIACDCGATTQTNIHPRSYGTFPKVLGEYVRGKRVLSLESAVAKMSGLPAAIAGMADRGVLAPGMAADVTLFDAERIAERGSFADPARLAEGVETVIVNGRIVWKQGRPTGATPGARLARIQSLPSRLPVDRIGPIAQRVALDGKREMLTISLRAGAVRQPQGSIAIMGGNGAASFRATRIGFVQTDGKGWFGVVGWGAKPGATATPFLLSIETRRACGGFIRIGDQIRTLGTRPTC
jgi:N-acyl-D-amino-acid deacylase